MEEISMSRVVRTSVDLLFVLSLVVVLGSVALAQSYTITALPGLNSGGQSSPSAVNNNGDVTGSSFTAAGDTDAFLWIAKTGVIQDLGRVGGTTSGGLSINDLDEIAGYSTTNGGGGSLYFATTFPGPTLLGTLPGGTDSFATGINNSLRVVGWSSVGGVTPTHAFLTDGGGLQDLGIPVVKGASCNNSNSFAYAVNSAGVITGLAEFPPNCAQQAFLWTSTGRFKGLGFPQGETLSVGMAINNHNQVVGRCGASAVACSWSRATGMQSLGVLKGGSSSAAQGVNDSGQVVGWSSCSGTCGIHAFLWTSRKGMQDLNNLIPPNSGWTLMYANGINKAGQITGSGTCTCGATGFLLTPVKAEYH
jgi:probable HAF family extracellular repeat protein